MPRQEIDFEYKGFTVTSEYEIEHDRDNAKIFYTCKDPQGNEISFDWTPYSYPTEQDFQTWVDLGRPGRVGCGPLRSETLIEIAKEQSASK